MLRPILVNGCVRQFTGVFRLAGVCQIALLSFFLIASSTFAQTSSSDPFDNGPQPTTPRNPDDRNAGGVTQADFDPLLDLIRSTINRDGWEANGGQATLLPYVSGVFADANGTLQFRAAKRSKNKTAGDNDGQNGLLDKARSKQFGEQTSENPRSDSKLRFISLRRLESFVARCLKQREALPEEVLTLAGLQEIQYIIVVPNSEDEPGDLLLAGPAGDWRTEPDGMIVGSRNSQPVIRFDDLLTLWRRDRPMDPFGVTIEPRASGLESFQQYFKATTVKPIKAAKRKRWVEGLKENLGKQDVKFFGLQPNSHVARVLLTADYHMKCIGMGLAEPVDGVQSYLKTVKLDENGQVPPMTVLRWWFAMNYAPVQVSEDSQVFQLNGPGAKVLSENQLLTARGQRVPTGKSEHLNRQFANTFSKEFPEICRKYPLYGEMKNIFDLSMTLAVIEKQQLLERSQWRPKLLLDNQTLKLPNVAVADEVEPIINHRVIQGKQIVAGVSGGVWVDAKKLLKINRDGEATFFDKALPEMPQQSQEIVWWWD